MKFLVIVAVFALVGYAILKKWRSIPPQTKQMWSTLFGLAGALRQAKKQAQQNGRAHAGATGGSTQVSSNLMLPCAQCGLHVPENEGVRQHGQFYCCAEHAK